VIGEELKAEARSVKSHERQLTKLNKICNVQSEQQPSGRKGMPVPSICDRGVRLEICSYSGNSGWLCVPCRMKPKQVVKQKEWTLMKSPAACIIHILRSRLPQNTQRFLLYTCKPAACCMKWVKISDWSLQTKRLCLSYIPVVSRWSHLAAHCFNHFLLADLVQGLFI